ncbi:gas vesicle protein GvpA/GvpJ/GvpM family [Lentzea atacamensis]|uniref:Gas vesicle protein GvpA/GvpJ/GvpM family n=2 Tax=Lentzea TaxID=165301 RepID=A0ABX9EJD4_9PSEU|nr:gas vesicle protein [Lentzea atacamensis]RAS70031.1 gas vesicle protein GvpA/GvpJ/GvpM family [Lentzea atacamensis]
MDNRSSSLADTLERVLDKGVVIVGDIAVCVVDIELLTLRVRLFVASAQTAREMGMDWWTDDPFFAPKAVERAAANELAAENAELRERLAVLERALEEKRP